MGGLNLLKWICHVDMFNLNHEPIFNRSLQYRNHSSILNDCILIMLTYNGNGQTFFFYDKINSQLFSRRFAHKYRIGNTIATNATPIPMRLLIFLVAIIYWITQIVFCLQSILPIEIADFPWLAVVVDQRMKKKNH